MAMEIIYLSDVRLSFPHIAEPQRNVNPETGDETISYNCDLIMHPNHPGFAEFMKRYSELAIEGWKENATAVMNMIASNRKSRCFGSGEEKVNQTTMKVFDGYSGLVYITANRYKVRPQLIDSNGNPIDPQNTLQYMEIARSLYAGCRVNVAVKPWLQNNKKGGKGVRCDLVAIQFRSHDAPFGESQPDVSNIFGAITAEQPAPSIAAPMPAVPFQAAPVTSIAPSVPFSSAPSFPPFMTGGQ